MTINPKFLTKSLALSPDRQILLEAAQLIRERGHAKQHLRDQFGAHCIAGAVNEAARGNHLFPTKRVRWFDRFFKTRAHWHGEAFKRLNQTVAAAYPVWVGATVMDWNNAPQRTTEQVIRALEDAALAPA